MSNYLTGQNSLEEVIKKSENEFVDIITTGPLPPTLVETTAMAPSAQPAASLGAFLLM